MPGAGIISQMSGYMTENKFVIAEGDEGDLYIFLQAKKEHPDEPRVIYDGYDHAIFMRRPEERIILDYIHPEVRDQLRKARRVVMVETILENIKESYYADMQVVDKIPVDWSKIGLKTWEEIVLKDKQV